MHIKMETWDLLSCLLAFIYVNNSSFKQWVPIQYLHHFLCGKGTVGSSWPYIGFHYTPPVLRYVCFLDSFPVLVYLGKSDPGGSEHCLVHFLIFWFQYREHRVSQLSFLHIVIYMFIHHVKYLFLKNMSKTYFDQKLLFKIFESENPLQSHSSLVDFYMLK